jgi:hypothetical protein
VLAVALVCEVGQPPAQMARDGIARVSGTQELKFLQRRQTLCGLKTDGRERNHAGSSSTIRELRERDVEYIFALQPAGPYFVPVHDKSGALAGPNPLSGRRA